VLGVGPLLPSWFTVGEPALSCFARNWSDSVPGAFLLSSEQLRKL
jgi:hypothetical protein